ncbi:type II toxin-antitoxin system YafQ family toxin [Ligilactobacillus acidipiscis]|uniref:type II toxin-antitoxin system YafQ family toxin n=1 Tax=Ligilactobacillus acidipiscis TaxID=89059 RepID=UPI00363ACA5F
MKDHALQGKWHGYREFHPARYMVITEKIMGWIVVYRIDHTELILLLVTTGPHEI